MSSSSPTATVTAGSIPDDVLQKSYQNLTWIPRNIGPPRDPNDDRTVYVLTERKYIKSSTSTLDTESGKRPFSSTWKALTREDKAHEDKAHKDKAPEEDIKCKCDESQLSDLDIYGLPDEYTSKNTYRGRPILVSGRREIDYEPEEIILGYCEVNGSGKFSLPVWYTKRARHR